jgi:hypothetical protein
MPNTTVSEIVTRPFVSSAASGSYSGDEFIAQNGQTLNLDLTKSASLVAPATSSSLAFSVNANESLAETVTVANGQVAINFSLSFDINIAITNADGTVTPFDTNISIFGDLTAQQPKSGCGGQGYGGGYGAQSYGAQSYGQQGGSHGGSGGDCGGQHQPAFTLTDADTVYAFNAPAANGFDALIVANNQPTSSTGTATVTDANQADEGAGGVIAGAALLQSAFGPGAPDPGQGISGDDGDLMRALAAAALAMIAQPNSQSTATAATLFATFVGGQLALDDGLAAFGVLANSQSPVSVTATPVAVMPGAATTHSGLGPDLFMVNPASGASTVAGFTPGLDQMRIDKALASSFASVLADATQTAQGVVMTFAPGHSVTLAGVNLASLHAGDFVFG